jgi:hypothetical protein
MELARSYLKRRFYSLHARRKTDKLRASNKAPGHGGVGGRGGFQPPSYRCLISDVVPRLHLLVTSGRGPLLVTSRSKDCLFFERRTQKLAQFYRALLFGYHPELTVCERSSVQRTMKSAVSVAASVETVIFVKKRWQQLSGRQTYFIWLTWCAGYRDRFTTPRFWHVGCLQSPPPRIQRQESHDTTMV